MSHLNRAYGYGTGKWQTYDTSCLVKETFIGEPIGGPTGNPIRLSGSIACADKPYMQAVLFVPLCMDQSGPHSQLHDAPGSSPSADTQDITI